MPGIVWLQQRHRARRFFLWDLAQNVFGKVILEFAERSHPIIYPIEQEEDRKTGQSSGTEADEQTFHQTWPD